MEKKENKEFNYIIKLWLKEKKEENEVKVQTIQRYENIVERYLSNTIGRIESQKLKKDDIIDFFKKGTIHNNSLSVQKMALYIIKRTIEIGYSLNMCKYIDMRKLKIKTPNKCLTVFTKRQQRKIDKFLTSDINVRKVVLLLCMYTGIRLGEASALKWKDINIRKKILSIRRTSIRIKNPDINSPKKTILITGTTKSETSTREIPIPSFIIPYLKSLKDEDEYYILSGSKKKYDPRLLSYSYTRTLKACKIEYEKFHTLRHTFATRCIESGVDAKTLSEILGHSNVQITLRLYVHPTYSMKKKSIEKATKLVKNKI